MDALALAVLDAPVLVPPSAALLIAARRGIHSGRVGQHLLGILLLLLVVLLVGVGH
ncbi:hypothetical protein I4F81_001296 [Pyropia yezoensis]|uniref:Uncharacterized protein n=1 Tax=Pyropia yezoensis TaxID=2788 RepID=A0ACC3BLQ5_PYRYE|nr:hypothetical protein I4F81_001296 [Neopyropia yezoensis]